MDHCQICGCDSGEHMLFRGLTPDGRYETQCEPCGFRVTNIGIEHGVDYDEWDSNEFYRVLSALWANSWRVNS